MKKITNAELIGKKEEIIDRNDNVMYDMFFVRVEYEDGSVKKVRAFSEPGTVNENNQSDVRRFILSRLGNLMKESGRTNYLFLGRYLPNDKDYVADRYYETDRGIAADVFEEEVYELRDAVVEMEKEQKAAEEKEKTSKDPSELVQTLKEKGVMSDTTKKRERLFPDREPEPYVKKFGGKSGKKEKPEPTTVQHRATFLPDPETYVLSDVHGFYGSYLEAMRSMTQFDTVYINGDVIDRGEDGIKIIEDIMRRTTHINAGPKVKFLVGNHEMQMMKCIEIIESLGLNAHDIGSYMEVGRYSYYKHLNLSKAKKLEGKMRRSKEEQKSLEEYRDTAEENDERMRKAKKYADRSHKGVLESEARGLFVWLSLNGGMPTLRSYLNLPTARQEELKKFVRDSAVMAKMTVDNKKHLVVHASPLNSEQLLLKFEENPFCEVKYRAIERDFNIINQVLQSRNNPEGFDLWNEAGYHTIFGHNPQKGFTVEYPEKNAINIDAGCSHGGKLALYNVRTNKTRYFEQKVELDRGQNAHDDR